MQSSFWDKVAYRQLIKSGQSARTRRNSTRLKKVQSKKGQSRNSQKKNIHSYLTLSLSELVKLAYCFHIILTKQQGT